MLDDFLREDDATSFLDEVQETETAAPEIAPAPDEGFLGMTAGQRLVISLMFFLMILVIGTFCLMITGSIGIPFR